MSSDILRIEREGAVARVVLQRPAVHNAFDEHLIAAITTAFEQLSADNTVRVIMLAGEGKSFSTGADLSWMGRMAGYSREENLTDARTAQRMFASIADCPKVTIARVQGAALGGGAGLVAACDIAIAAESAIFAFSEVRLGIIPATIAPFVLQKISVGAARALFVTGRRFGATEALRVGLVQEVVPDGELDTVVGRVVGEVLAVSPQAVVQVKSLLRSIAGKPPADVADETVERLADIRVSAEGQEGIHAFLEKRKPGWQNG
jgi:methylglutaconyl-CoA hydratase